MKLGKIGAFLSSELGKLFVAVPKFERDLLLYVESSPTESFAALDCKSSSCVSTGIFLD